MPSSVDDVRFKIDLFLDMLPCTEVAPVRFEAWLSFDPSISAGESEAEEWDRVNGRRGRGRRMGLSSESSILPSSS